MILVDSSILIAFLRKGSPVILSIFETQDCSICGVTRAEILHGSRTIEDTRQLITALNQFAQISIPEDTWDQLGHHLAILRSAGLTLPFQDVLLSTVAIQHNAELWSLDQHFRMIQSHLPALRLFISPAI